MPSYSQADRPIGVDTPLGRDALLLIGFKGEEGISRLFNFQLELLSDGSGVVDFDKLLGGDITISVALPENKHRYINGICRQVSQGMQGEVFTQYSMEIVPQVWLLTKRAKSQIFQHKTVPQILEQVLAGQAFDLLDTPDVMIDAPGFRPDVAESALADPPLGLRGIRGVGE